MKKRFFAIMLLIVVILISSQVFAATHTVQWGDTLWKIAVKYQVGLSELIQSNPQLKNPNLIYPGQKITIPDLGDVKTLESEVVRLVNRERAKRGLASLTENWELSRVARYKSQDMINKGYFSHTSPTYGAFSRMIESFNIRFSAAGENIAYGQRTPEEVMTDWMNSTGHRNNILSPIYTHIGVGLARKSNGVSYWTQMFIKSAY